MGRLRSDPHPLHPPPAALSRTASSPSPSSDTNLSVAKASLPKSHHPNLELQLLTKATSNATDASTKLSGDHSTLLQLSIGSSEITGDNNSSSSGDAPARMKEQAQEQLRIAMAEKAFAEEARKVAKRQIEVAEEEFTKAKRIRQQAAAEIEKAQNLKDHATKKINSVMLEITCHSCKNRFHQNMSLSSSSSPSSIELSFVSAKLREWEVKKGD